MEFGNEILQDNKEEDVKVKIWEDKHKTVQVSYITLSVDAQGEKMLNIKVSLDILVLYPSCICCDALWNSCWKTAPIIFLFKPDIICFR